MGRKKINPPRKRTKEQERADYHKQLAVRQVSGTVETTGETKATIVEELNGTDKIKPVEQAPISTATGPIKNGQKLKKTHYTIAIIGSVIGILIFVAIVASNYTSLKESISNTNVNLKELKQSINERINRLEERIDKYISKEKTK